jgi:sialate O-acetylesterase
MIVPVAPYAVRGAIWYQGESNARKARHYQKLLTLMIDCWRKAWGQDQYAFHIVSLANYNSHFKFQFVLA